MTEEIVGSVAELEAIYGKPGNASLAKVATRMTPAYRRWIEASKFCVLSTVGLEGTDASPRGDDGPVVQVLDDGHLALPDWHGNNRMDSLRNIVSDGRVSLMFMVPGSNNVVRSNGHATVNVSPNLLARFSDSDRKPRSIVVVAIDEIYFQCARALMRSNLWKEVVNTPDLPSPGQILSEMTHGVEGGAEYDDQWPVRAKRTLW